jgi:hypothetical protein
MDKPTENKDSNSLDNKKNLTPSTNIQNNNIITDNSSKTITTEWKDSSFMPTIQKS